jgi:hypothetical protein
MLLGLEERAIVSGYGSVYAPKAFDPVHGLGFFMKNPIQEVEGAYESVFQNLLEYQRFLSKYNIPLVVLLFPQRFQVQTRDWELTVKEYALKKKCFDLDRPNKIIMKLCGKKGLKCIDPTSKMRMLHEKTGEELYLPLGDMHWNAKGHEALVDSIWENLSLDSGIDLEEP